MSDSEVREALTKLSDRVGQLETEVRVAKHDINNMMMASQGLITRIDKVEDRLSADIKALAQAVTAINVKQERGAGFFAGMAAVFTVSGGVLIALAKALFGG